MNRSELLEILLKHKEWTLNKPNGLKADLSGADLSEVNLSEANLSEAKGLPLAIDFLNEYFEKTSDGFIAYKTFDSFYDHNELWKIEKGSIINENINYHRNENCGCGINVSTLDWVLGNVNNLSDGIWRVLIRWEWLCGVCVPYNSDGKIRCERVELLEKLSTEEYLEARR